MKKNKCQCIVLKLYNTRIMILKGVSAIKNLTQLFNFKETFPNYLDAEKKLNATICYIQETFAIS